MIIELNLDCIYDELKESIIAIVMNNARLGRTTDDEQIAKMTSYPKKILDEVIVRMKTDKLLK